VVKRTNQEWLEALRGPQRDEALADLRGILVRGLRVALASQAKVSEDDLEDFAQDALVKILAALDSFRGESRLTTWAHKIAIRVALTELRRRRWRDVSLDSLIHATDADFLPDTLPDPAVGPEEQAIQRMVLETMRRVIAEDLTDKQRQALVATRVHDMPLEEVARRMGTNRNALYKLLHDARQRLRKELMAKGLPPEEVLSAFGLKAKVRDRQPTASKSRGVK
jgi:RNA polymerase sigma-70 factor (ECF subfamily)